MRDLLDLDVDVNAFLPPDTLSAGYDNIADVQTFSPTLMEGYLRAAARISTLAVGDRNASPSEFTVKVPRTAVADAARRRHAVGHARRHRARPTRSRPTATTSFRIMLHGTPTGQLFGSVASRNEQIDLSINGERVALLDIDWQMSETDKNGLNLVTPRIHVKAGPQHIAAAFIQKFDGVVDDLVAPIDYTLADTEYGDNAGITILPHVRDFSITGPYKVTGVSDTPSRRKVFICRPTSPADEIPCARKILSSLAGEAYRRDAEQRRRRVADEVLRRRRARATTSRPASRAALQALLASPKFVFRFESSADAGQGRADLPHQRHRSGVAAVVLPLGHDAGRGAGEGGDRRHAAHAGGARQAGAPHAGRSARRGAVDALRRRSGCGCRTSRRSIPTRCCSPASTTTLAAVATSARPSCSSTASCARIATSSTC